MKILYTYSDFIHGTLVVVNFTRSGNILHREAQCCQHYPNTNLDFVAGVNDTGTDLEWLGDGLR